MCPSGGTAAVDRSVDRLTSSRSDFVKMSAMSSSVGVFGHVASSRCCFIVPGTRSGTSDFGVADAADPVGDADVPHQRFSTLGSRSRGSFTLSARGSISSAARRCRSGARSKENRNASGAVSDTDCPCGTIGSSCG